jgi:hypothetical protein
MQSALRALLDLIAIHESESLTKEIDADRFYPEPGEVRATIPNGIHLIVSGKLAISSPEP